MKKSTQYILMALALGLILLTRLIPHISNFTPIFAIGIFASTIFKNKKISLFLPLFGMFLSDIFIGFYSTAWANYLALFFAISISIIYNLKNRYFDTFSKSLVAPTIFYILSNFVVFFAWYPQSIEGFVSCYVNAIPFYGASLLSTLAYSVVFTVFAKKYSEKLELAR
jgi:hypothetical protein